MKNNDSNRIKLLYPEEHIKCLHYVSDNRCFFKCYTLVPEERFQLRDNNHIIFILEGNLVMLNRTADKFLSINKQQVIFISRYTSEPLYTDTGCQLLICSFDIPLNTCDKLIFNEIQFTESTTEFPSLPIKKPMSDFIDLLLFYLQNNVNCEHLHEIKQKEMFLIFKWFYTKNELSLLFHPLSSKYYEFKCLVMENYEQANDVSELAALIGMSRTRFDVKFKEEFGTSARQWMLKQLAHKIQYAANEPGITIDMLIHRFNFNSTVSFIRFCKAQFGCTPKELIGKTVCNSNH